MRIASVDGRLCLVTPGGYLDVANSSNGRSDADPQAVYERWHEFTDWARSYPPERGVPVRGELGPPVPRPAQVFGIGLNYADHAGEAALDPIDLHRGQMAHQTEKRRARRHEDPPGLFVGQAVELAGDGVAEVAEKRQRGGDLSADHDGGVAVVDVLGHRY